MKPKSWQLKLFYLILFLIPCNLAKHFILPSSYVSGILVDYLIPTLYLTDILIIILLGSELPVPRTRDDLRRTSELVPNLVFILFLLLLPSVIFASSPIPALYKYLKFLELFLFALWIKQNIDLKKHLSSIVTTLSLSVLFQSLLSLAQWFKQSSIFGYWFFGEQPFNSATPGIDKITWFTGAIKIPPMGTFPHPNVLGGFLAVVLPLILYQLLRPGKGPSSGSELPVPRTRDDLRRMSELVPNLLRFLTLFLGLITLFLTFSLSAWLAFLLIGLPLVLQGRTLQNFKIRPYWKFIMIYYGSLLIILSLFGQKFSFLAPESSFTRRSQLTNIAWQMFLDHPITGVGLNNFTLSMEKYGYVAATTRFLQPVHNIYLLILSETGIIGLTGCLFLLYKGRTLFTDRVRPCHLLLFLGLFDHYLLTLQQGLLLLTYIFSGVLIPNKSKP